MAGRKDFLVLTLFTGENEYPESRASVEAQLGVTLDHEVVAHLGNLDAHRTLYRRVEEAAGEYRWFIKLDADMKLTRSTALQEVIDFLDSQDDVDGYPSYTEATRTLDIPNTGLVEWLQEVKRTVEVSQ